MRDLDEIVVHCAATKPSWFSGAKLREKIAEIRKWHINRQPPFRDIGYHFIIDTNGERGYGRPVEEAGAHVPAKNATGIAICLIGGFDSRPTDQFLQHYTAAQDKALRELIAELRQKYPTIKRVSGHNEYTDKKACPGFHVPTWYAAKPLKPAAPAVPPVAPKLSFWAALLKFLTGGPK